MIASLYTLLPWLGIRLKTPRPRHTQADPVQIGWSYIYVAVAIDPRTGRLWWAR